MSIFSDLVNHFGLSVAYEHSSMMQPPVERPFNVIYDTVQWCQKNWKDYGVVYASELSEPR
jgi:hypothetical protein